MNRTRSISICAAVALLFATAAIAAPDGTAMVESAGKDGGQPVHTAQVGSAEMPSAATPLPMIAAVAAGALAIGLVFSMRRSRHAPPA